MNAAALLVSEIIPAVRLGLGTVLMRGCIGAGAGIPVFSARVGTVVAIVG